jgi:hypothetical protein
MAAKVAGGGFAEYNTLFRQVLMNYSKISLTLSTVRYATASIHFAYIAIQSSVAVCVDCKPPLLLQQITV